MLNRASVGIFQKKINKKKETKPSIPDEIFELAKKVEKDRNTEILRTKDGFFIVTYSENGPFSIRTEGWMKVQVFCIREWQSGGIKTEELQKYESKE